MPYVPDAGYVLSPAQEALRQIMIAASKELRPLPRYEGPLPGHLMGHLVQPPHTVEGLALPERRYPIYYAKGYGVVAPAICTSNGSCWEIASCVRDDTQWVEFTQ